MFDICVISVYDVEQISVLKVFVVLKDNLVSEDFAQSEILSFCFENLLGYMVPEFIGFWLELPYMDRGKIDYRALENENS